MSEPTMFIIMFSIASIILTVILLFLKEKKAETKTEKKKAFITLLSIATISVILTILTECVSVIIENELENKCELTTNSASIKYDFDEFVVGNADPSFDDLKTVENFFNNYLNSMQDTKALSDEDLKKNKEITTLILIRQQTDDLKEQLDLTQKMYNLVSNNSSVVNTYATLKQDYAIELYSSRDPKTEDVFLQAIEINFHLLSLTDTSTNKSDVYYRIGQCFEYLSLIEEESCNRNQYQDSLSAITFFKFAYTSNDYKRAYYYGYPYAMSGIVSHRIAKKMNYEHTWYEFANTEYKIALKQLPPNCDFVITCNNGLAELETQISSECFTE